MYDKTYILSTYNQVTIFSTYLSLYTNLKISPEEIFELANKNKKVSSPFRIDNNPSVGFKYSSPNRLPFGNTDYEKHGKLKMRDFLSNKPSISNVFWGDCFDLVGYIINKNPNNPSEFSEIAKHIVKTLSGEYDKNIKIDNLTKIKETERTVIEYSLRRWNRLDIEYWKQYNLSTKDLEINFIYPVDKYWINYSEFPNYKYNHLDPCYMYLFGEDEYKIEKIQMYHPFRNKKDSIKFIINCGGLLATHFIKGDKVFILMKSYKDLVVLNKLIAPILTITGFTNLSPNDISFSMLNSEAVFLSDKQGEFIKRNFKYTFVHGDWDRQGKLFMNYHRKTFGFIPLTTKDKSAKDISDYISKYGLNETINFLKNKLNECSI